MCEKSLIQDVKLNKSESSFAALIELHREKLHFFIQSRTRKSSLDVDEIYNLVLSKVWNNIDSFREESSFRTWIFQISKNTIYDEFNRLNRREQRFTPLLDSDSERTDSKTPETDIMDEEAHQELMQRITNIKDSLSDKHRRVFELVFEQGVSYLEASKILGCSIGTVMSRAFYARKKAREVCR